MKFSISFNSISEILLIVPDAGFSRAVPLNNKDFN
jgi:hypothetical protein